MFVSDVEEQKVIRAIGCGLSASVILPE